MRNIKYIFIEDSSSEKSARPRRNSPVSPFRYHYVVNSEGLVIPSVDISHPVSLISGPCYDPDKYNRCSICIRYDGSLRSEAWLINPDLSCSAAAHQRNALIDLLVELRSHFPDAKILGSTELDDKAIHSCNIIVSDTMNLLRKDLSELHL